MKKNNLNIIIYGLLGIIVIVLLWKIVPIIKDKVIEKELVFNLKEEKLEVEIGGSNKIEYELSEEINIIWESEDQSIVEVNNGIVNGKGLGSTRITGTVIKGEEKISRSIIVNTYYGDTSIVLDDFNIPEGELFITRGDSYKIPIEYIPENGYITSLEYEVVDSNIVEYNEKVEAKNIGTTEIIIKVNDISKEVKVNVVEKEIEPVFTNKVSEVNIISEEIELKVNEEKKIDYSVIPEGAFVETVKWTSSDEKIVEVNEGLIVAKGSGEATVELLINEEIRKEIKVKVNIPVSGINIETNPKLVMKVGEKESIKANVIPSNATNKKVKYTSSNNYVSVDENGIVRAIGKGSGTIEVATIDGNYKKTISYTVNPKVGYIGNDGGVWGYTSPNDKVPVRAEKSFFQNLASKGKGTLSGNVYTYNDGKKTYRYDLSTSTLTSGSTKVLARIYYPEGVDLSTTNTLTFCNGTGTAGFVGFLSAADNDRSMIKSSGIIILIGTYNGGTAGYDSNGIILATDFVKSIVKQKSGVKNAVGGYSGSGWEAGKAASNGNYDRLIMYCSAFHANLTTNLKNKEIIVYLPKNDQTMGQAAKTTLNYLYMNNYSNVTVISNDSGVTSDGKYRSNFLVIDPGNPQGSGHAYRNIAPTKLFSYACR